MSVSEVQQAAIAACNLCADACEQCAAQCLRQADVSSLAACIRLDLDCAAVCRCTASLLARESTFFITQCLLCANVCVACSLECLQFVTEHCRDCADACSHCADACRRAAA